MFQLTETKFTDIMWQYNSIDNISINTICFMYQVATIQWIMVMNVVIEIMWFSVVHVYAGGQVNHQPPPHAHHLLSVCDVCDHHLLCPYQRPSCHSQKQVRVLLRGNTVVSSGKLMSMNILCSSYQYYHCEIIKLKYWF